MEQAYKSILTQINTKEQVDETLSCIDAILESFYKEKKSDYKKIIDKSLNIDLAEVLKKSLDTFSSSDGGKLTASDAGSSDSSEVENRDRFSGTTDFLASLKDNIQKFKVIKLTIAFSPTPDCIKTISSFIKEKFGEEYILDIEQDPKILGGAIIVYDGRYQDFSLKKALDEMFEKRREEIISLLNC